MFRLITLGRLSLEREGAPGGAPAVQRRRLALLTLVARSAGGTGMTRDKVAAFLWPESDETRARNSLKQAISALRRELGPELFLAGPDIRLDPQVVACDCTEFEERLDRGELEPAVRGYTGPFLDGFHLGGDAEEFERWSDLERTRLDARLRGALESLAADAMARGDTRAAARWKRRLAEIDPLDGRVAAELVAALVATGERSAARLHAREHAAVVRREFGTGADPQVEAALAGPITDEGNPGPRSTPEPPVSRNDREIETPVRRSRARTLAAAVALVLVCSGAVLLAGVRAPSVPPRRIAVLPFQNLGRPADGFFAIGLTDELTAQLAGYGGLQVIAPASARDYEGSSRNAREIGRELGVDYLLQGGITWSDPADSAGRVRITSGLIRIADGRHVWADVFESDRRDLFALQDLVAEHVAKALDANVGRSADSAERRPSRNLDAYAYYVRASGYLDRFNTDSQHLNIAAELYAKAVELDPAFALAWARLSQAHSLLFWRGYDERPARATWAKEAANAALRLAPELPEAQMAAGWYYMRVVHDPAEALAAFTPALAARPFNSDLLEAVGAVERRLGRYAEAANHLRRAVSLDPRSSNKAMLTGITLVFLRDYAEANHYLSRAITLQPDWPLPYAARAQLQLAWHGDTLTARSILRQAMTRVPVADLVGHLGYFGDVGFAAFLFTDDPDLAAALERLTGSAFSRFPYGAAVYHLTKAYADQRAGRPGPARAHSDSARRVLEPLTHEPGPDDVPFVMLAHARAGLGDVSGALAAAETAVAMRPPESDRPWAAERSILLAHLYLMIGREGEAVRELERLLEEPSPLSVEELRVDPTWRSLTGQLWRREVGKR